MPHQVERRMARLQELDFGEKVIRMRAFDLDAAETVAPSGPGATIIPGATVAFGEGIGSDMRTDIEDALYLSSLAADQKASRRYPSREWYDEYVSWLETCGFLVTSQVFQRRTSASNHLEMAKEA